MPPTTPSFSLTWSVADEDRTARFMSVVALIDTDGLVTYGEGACEGVIAHEGRGDHGFGYDPLFLPVDTPGKTMAELTADEKNAISHRFPRARASVRQTDGRGVGRACGGAARTHAGVTVDGRVRGQKLGAAIWCCWAWATATRAPRPISCGASSAACALTRTRTARPTCTCRCRRRGSRSVAVHAVRRLPSRPPPIVYGCRAPDVANELYEYFLTLVRQDVEHVAHGIFGADMKVDLVNDGPFTIVLDTDNL